jgi:hypothetical protein
LPELRDLPGWLVKLMLKRGREPQKPAGLRHRLAHLLGWNEGTVETWWDGDVLMVGFRCGCGEMMHPGPAHLPPLRTKGGRP